MNTYKIRKTAKDFMINIKNLIRKNPKITVIMMCVLICIIIIALIFSYIESNKDKQKYIIYDGKNLNEDKYP